MPDASSPRILVADDEVPQMRALCDTLREHGFETVGESSALAALETLRRERFDLLLTDLMMPEMDGLTLLRAATAIDPHLVGVVMTGEGSISTAVEAMKSGALDYILKPFRLNVMLPVLWRALAMRRLRLEKDELEGRIRERTAELEATNEELDAFTHSVSHDLRAPLRAISGFTTILLQHHTAGMTAEASRLLGMVATNAGRMEQLIEDLLRLARMGLEPVTRQPVNVAALVRQAIEELASEQAGRRIELTVGELPDCAGDASLLKQVFVNLLANALKFTRQREAPRIEIGCREEDGARVYYVRDNGVGFDMYYVGRLFGVFQRLHREDQFEGTGVGLSIVRRIVQLHGGKVWGEGAVDQGATFRFTLPADTLHP